MLALIPTIATLLATTAAAAPEPPRTWAIVIGVGELADPGITPVPHGPADAERVRDHLTTAVALPADRVLLLSDGGAPFLDPASPAHAAPTRRNVRLAVTAWLRARVAAGDLALVVWSGQAAVGPAGEPLLVTSDAARDDLAGTAVDASWIAAELAALPGASAALIVDASFGGRGAPALGPDARANARSIRFETLTPGRVSLWLAASTDARAVEHGPHGAFTRALLVALRDGTSPDDAWARLVAALPEGAPRPLRFGRADLAPLFAKRAPRERPELVLQTPHMGSVVDARFDPTGRRLATTGSDGTLKLWSLSSHRIIANLETPGGSAGVVWSADGERLLAEGPRGVTVWSAAGRELWRAPADIAAWPARGDAIRDVMRALATFSPDGRLVVIPHPDRPVEVRAAEDGRTLATFGFPTGIGVVVFDPSGARLAIPAPDRTSVLIVDAKRWRTTATLPGEGTVASVVWSADGRTLAIGRIEPGRGGDFPPQRVTLHDATRRFAVRRAPAPLATELPLATSPDGRWLAAPVRDGVALVRLDTLATTTIGRAESGDTHGGVVQFAPDSQTVALYMADDTRLYDLGGALLRTIRGEAIALAPDLSAVLAGSSRNHGDGLELRDAAGRHPPRPLEAEARPIVGLALAPIPAGARLVMREAERPPVVWDLALGKPTADAPSPVGSAAAPARPASPLPGHLAWPLPAGRLALTSEASAKANLVEAGAPQGAFDVVLWDVAGAARAGALVGHRDLVTGVVASPDGKTIVTSSRDTTMRLWEAATGKPLATVALLAPVDGEPQWVITTPDGLFDGSPKGQATMQWRVGDALFRLEQYAGDYYTPGLFGRLFAGERPRAAAALEDLRPPPRVRITSPARGASVAEGVAKVIVKVEDQGGGATPAWLYVNGRRVPTTRARPRGGAAEAFEVELVEGDNHLVATAFNRDGTVESAGDEVTITWAVPEAERPVLHIVAVGVDAYEDPSLRLSFAVAEAIAISQEFAPGLFGKVERTLVLDARATRPNIRAAIADVAKRARPRDALVVYLAGHGALVGSTFYFLPWEARATSDDEVARTGLPQAELAEALTLVPAMKQVVVLDACHSGAGATAIARLVGSRDAVGLARAQRRLARASGVFLVAASTAAQKAGEIRELGHGILTYALLVGIGAGGKPPAARTSPEGHVTMNALLAWLDDEVPRLTAKHHGGPQNPVQASTGQDFPIAIGAPK
ncbi:MAG: caspase family protein [Deltaproteobacteria bacterium]|nr:caspase family protein [Deltaproteobacteria bacterium]